MDILLNQHRCHIDGQQAHRPLLAWLRESQGLFASKEGCGAGDCGACSVLVGRLENDQLVYQAVNACLVPVASLQGCHLITLDGLSPAEPHAVQQALIDCHASQCGFCTPGIVIAMLAWWLNTPANALRTNAQRQHHRQVFTQALSGNLCRCTGYEPIFRAAQGLAASTLGGDLTGQSLAGLSTQDIIGFLQSAGGTTQAAQGPQGIGYYQPHTEAQLALAFELAPHARVIAGSTDVGLEVTQQLQDHQSYIDLSRLPSLAGIELINDQLHVGAAVTFSQLEAYFSQHDSVISPAWLELLELIGSRQIRNRGTIGGNIANGSPIADTPPLLLALDASLVLQQGEVQRQLALRDFFLSYRQTALRPGEVITQIRIPMPSDKSQLCISKISKRHEDDISAVCLAMLSSQDDSGQLRCRIGVGGMAATPAIAVKAAEVVANQGDRQAICAAIGAEFNPLNDVRASADYRLQVCANTLYYWSRAGDSRAAGGQA